MIADATWPEQVTAIATVVSAVCLLGRGQRGDLRGPAGA